MVYETDYKACEAYLINFIYSNHVSSMIKIKIKMESCCSNHELKFKDMVLGLFHQYGNEGCDRWSSEGLSENRVQNSSLWTVTIPHPRYSGRCFTYRYF